jgi:Gluconate 2-dehydrogenase subunit 3
MNNFTDSSKTLMEPMDRRKAVQWMLASLAATSVIKASSPAFAASPVSRHTLVAKGYGTDPDLNRVYHPGELWPLTFTETQRRQAAVLCDLIFPADETSPSASSLKVHDFVNEWISSPYPESSVDLEPITECLKWFDEEAQKRFQKALPDLSMEQLHSIADDVAFGAKQTQFQKPAKYFSRFKYVVAGGFYTTPDGMKDIGYVGNVPTVNFDGPTPEALKHVGLA